MIKLKSIFVLILVIVLFVEANAQSTSSYTRYGLGDVQYSYSARSLSMGHSGSALLNKDYVEIFNPASWSGLSRTRIEFSFVYNGLLLSNNSESKFYGDGDFKGFTFAFPVSQDNGVGVAMGVVPYSRLNYSVVLKDLDEGSNVGPYTSTYEGKGGLSKIFIGSSVKVPADIILGATLDYYFGNLKYNSKIEFSNSTVFPSEYELRYGPTGFGTTVGLISPDLSGMLNSETISDVRLSLSGNLISKLNADTSLTTRSSSIIDSVGTGETKMEVPFRINAGLSITLSEKYILVLDYFFQPWTEFKLNNVKQKNLKDAHKISTGFEYRPKKTLGASYWEQIMFRAGLSFEKSQYTFNGNEVDQYSAFAGFSLPLSPENTFDFAFEYSMRGTTENNLLKENFFRFNLGISFGDIWFLRYEK
ncbi:MAG: hypothetical protein KJN64_08200 [Ignavibacteria bacterium]|nr:hypothetical protein [Ignavibacteria bacterium]